MARVGLSLIRRSESNSIADVQSLCRGLTRCSYGVRLVESVIAQPHTFAPQTNNKTTLFEIFVKILVDLLLITIKSARRIKEQTHGGFGKDFDFFCMIVGKTLDHTRLDTIVSCSFVSNHLSSSFLFSKPHTCLVFLPTDAGREPCFRRRESAHQNYFSC
jgi:hypothetical protein